MDGLLNLTIRWSFLSKFMRLKIAQAASFVPVFGYLIILSDKFEGFISNNRYLWLTTDQKIYLLYFGSLCLTFSLIVYTIRCPRYIKKFPDIEDYIAAEDSSCPKFRRRQIVLENCKFVTPSIFDPDDELLERSRHNPDITYEYTEKANKFLMTKYRPDSIAHYSSGKTSRNTFEISYLGNEQKNSGSLYASLIFATLGTFMISIPSAEVFMLTIKTILNDLFQYQ